MVSMGWPPGIPDTTYDRTVPQAAKGPPTPSPADARRRKVALLLVLAAFIAIPAAWFWWSLGNGNPRLSVAALEIGRCIDEWRGPDGSLISRPSSTLVKPVDCNVIHDGEIVGTTEFVAAGSEAPSYGQMALFAGSECERQLEAYTGAAPASSGLMVTFAFPDNATWATGDHSILCIAGFAKASLFESVRGSPR